jgi:hypothetical protein
MLINLKSDTFNVFDVVTFNSKYLLAMTASAKLEWLKGYRMIDRVAAMRLIGLYGNYSSVLQRPEDDLLVAPNDLPFCEQVDWFLDMAEASQKNDKAGGGVHYIDGGIRVFIGDFTFVDVVYETNGAEIWYDILIASATSSSKKIHNAGHLLAAVAREPNWIDLKDCREMLAHSEPIG